MNPVVGSVGSKVITRDTALLFYVLREPGPLPEYLHKMLGSARDSIVKRLVLDGVLELEREDGTFVHGAAAMVELGSGNRKPVNSPRDYLSTLSLQAIEYGAKLEEDEPGVLADHLYRFNRLPLTAKWERVLPDSKAVSCWLGSEAGTLLGRKLERAYVRSESPSWYHWRGRTSRLRSGFSHKLYISPRPEALPQVFAFVADACLSHEVRAFKVGCNLSSVLRPDKLVLYFEGEEPLHRIAEKLRMTLKDVESHGVPFTATIDPAGLLSWGMDPPGWQAVSDQNRHSWRLFIVDRIAIALVSAQRNSEVSSPVNFALERIRLEGIDPQSWTAPKTLWTGEGREILKSLK